MSKIKPTVEEKTECNSPFTVKITYTNPDASNPEVKLIAKAEVTTTITTPDPDVDTNPPITAPLMLLFSIWRDRNDKSKFKVTQDNGRPFTYTKGPLNGQKTMTSLYNIKSSLAVRAIEKVILTEYEKHLAEHDSQQ